MEPLNKVIRPSLEELFWPKNNSALDINTDNFFTIRFSKPVIFICGITLLYIGIVIYAEGKKRHNDLLAQIEDLRNKLQASMQQVSPGIRSHNVNDQSDPTQNL